MAYVVLSALQWMSCLVRMYIDDIAVMDQSFREHLYNMGEVFQRICHACSNSNLTRVFLEGESFKYLGQIWHLN